MKKSKIIIIVVVFGLAFLSMVASVFFRDSPAIFKTLDTISVGGFVMLFAAGTVACANVLNDTDFGSNPVSRLALKVVVYYSGILSGAASFGFVTLIIIKHIEHVESISRLSFEPYAWLLALLVGTIFLGLSRKILMVRKPSLC